MSDAADIHGRQPSGQPPYGQPHGLPDGSAVRVTGGDLTAEEAAALAVALDAARTQDRRTSETGAEPTEPAWLRAGRRELLGGPPVASPTDLSEGAG